MRLFNVLPNFPCTTKEWAIVDSENKMLKQQVVDLLELKIKNQSRNKVLEQHGRRFWLHIDDVATVKDESSDDVLDFKKSLFEDYKSCSPGQCVRSQP